MNWLNKTGLVLFGLLLSAVALEAGLRACGAVVFYLQHRTNAAAAGQGAFRILCLGESTTARGGADSWPAQLEEVLNSSCTDGTRFRVFNEGREATQSSYVLAALPDNVRRYRPDMVVCMLGINDGPATVAFDASLGGRLRLAFDSLRVVKLFRIIASRARVKLAQDEFLRNAAQPGAVTGDGAEWDDLAKTEDALIADMRARPDDPGPRAALGRFYSDMAARCRARGRDDLAVGFFGKAAALRAGIYVPATRENYRRIWKILSDSGIRLVCMQYPVRAIAPLEKLLSGCEPVVFVDNEKVFRDALAANEYSTIFTDRFGGDFGHATRFGNRLIAKNLASAVLESLGKNAAVAAVGGVKENS